MKTNLFNHATLFNILDDVIENKPLDIQLPLFVNLYGKEYGVLKVHTNCLKLNTEKYGYSFYNFWDLVMNKTYYY